MRRHALPLSLIAFGILYFVSLALANRPDPAWSDADTIEFYADSGNRAKLIVDAYVALAAGALLILIVALMVAAARRRSADDVVQLTAAISGTAFAALFLAAHAAFLAPVAYLSLGFGEASEIQPTVAKATDGVGSTMLLGMAQLPAGIFVACASWALFALALGRRRLGITGVVFGILIALLTFFWFGLLLLSVWALVSGVALMLNRDQPAAAAA